MRASFKEKMRQKVFVGIESQTRTMFDASLFDAKIAISSANPLKVVSQALNLTFKVSEREKDIGMD